MNRDVGNEQSVMTLLAASVPPALLDPKGRPAFRVDDLGTLTIRLDDGGDIEIFRFHWRADAPRPTELREIRIKTPGLELRVPLEPPDEDGP